MYNGAFKNITQEGINVLEKCLKFSALNYDLFLDEDLLQSFSMTIKQSNSLLDELPILDNNYQSIRK